MTKRITFVFFLIAALLSGGAFDANAQQDAAAAKDGKTVKNALAGIVRAKQTGGGFALLTPGDLARSASNGSPNAGDPCEEATAIDIGQTIGNALNSTDCRLDDGSYADFYVFQGTAGQQITIQMDSSAVDSYLGLTNESGSFVVEDDDSGGGLSARIVTTLPETGLYAILANSALPNQFGGYTLALSGAARCTFAVSPNTQTAAATGGTYSFNITTQPECYWSAVSINNFTTISNPNGRGNGTVTYTVSQNGTGSTRSGSILVGSAPLPGVQVYFNITQPSIVCAYSFSPATLNLSGAAQNSSFLFIAPSGCPWIADSGSYTTITNNASGSGSAQIGFSIRQNNGAARTDIISFRDYNGNRIAQFTINQAGLNCAFTITPHEIKIGRQGGTRSLNINAQPGCVWSARTDTPFIHLITNSGSGAGSVTFRVDAQTEQQDRSGAIQFDFGSADAPFRIAFIDQSKNSFITASDFDGDGKSDVSVFRPSDGVWYLNRSTAGYAGYQFGAASDKLVPADYDGDGKTDVAVYRDGYWFILKSSNLGFASYNFGLATDIPMPADFNGDGRAELAVFRPSDGTWYQLNLVNNAFTAVGFGVSGDVPIAADYDGDGRADVAVYRPSNGVWYLNRSRDGYAGYQFGSATDKIVPADYDGDGKTDVAVYRPSEGYWFILRSSNLSFFSQQFGLSGDTPSPADFDGDGRADLAVYRTDENGNGNWFQLKSSEGFGAVLFGSSGDKPTQSAFNR